MTRKSNSKDFKEDALRLAEREGVSQACEKLGLRPNQIYDWRRHQASSQSLQPKGMKTVETLEEYTRRLEHEVSELTEANTILKKAMGFMVGR